VAQRAARADVALAFLATYAALLAARSLALGEPLAIPIHRLENGGLLLFAFFMISDPRTTPDARAGRLLFGCLVAVAAAFLQFRFFRTNGPIWSLFFLSPLVPAIDRLLPARRFVWTDPKGVFDATPAHPALVPLPSPVGGSRTPVLRLLRGSGGREGLQPRV